MLFNYKGITPDGETKQGVIDASNNNNAVATLQRRGIVILDIKLAKKKSVLSLNIFERVTAKDLVILSRQLSTLFEAQVTVINSFKLMSEQSEKGVLRNVLEGVVNKIQSGSTVSQALASHSEVFSDFYINIVRVGEETGRLSDTFSYLADYLERQYELVSKARHAMIYPTFIITVFIAVMSLMFTAVIPKLTIILEETGTELPIYTKIVIAVSDFMVNYGILVFLFITILGLAIWRASFSDIGKEYISKFKYTIPGVSNLFQKFYLSRIADNLDATITSGIQMIHAIEITRDVVGDYQYKKLLDKAREEVKGGGALSKSLGKSELIPPIMTQMIRVGEETGKLGFVLGTVSRFYKREVEDAIDSLISLIEPAMIILLGIGVGVLLVSILLPIYNLAGSF